MGGWTYQEVLLRVRGLLIGREDLLDVREDAVGSGWGGWVGGWMIVWKGRETVVGMSWIERLLLWRWVGGWVGG